LIQVVLRSDESDLCWEQKETALTDEQEFTQWFLKTEAAATAKAINGDISVTPPLRICAYVSSGPPFVILSIHHALFDGISLPILMNDVENEYLNHVPRSPVPSSEILDQISRVDLDKARGFWIDYFQKFSWPYKVLRQAPSSLTKRQVTAFRTPLSTVKSLATLQQVTLQALLTCTFAKIVAHRVYQSNDVTFGVSSFYCTPNSHFDII
jgi:hypothetical protein